MPVSADPNAVRNYTLRGDQKLPAEQRPVFRFRYMTRRQKQGYLAGLEGEALRGLTGEEAMRKLYAALSGVLAGWEGLRAPATHAEPLGPAVPFRAGHLEDLDLALTDTEIWELFYAGASELDDEDLRFFASRPSSAPAGSANREPRAAQTAGALTPPPPNSPGIASAPPATAEDAAPAAEPASPT